MEDEKTSLLPRREAVSESDRRDNRWQRPRPYTLAVAFIGFLIAIRIVLVGYFLAIGSSEAHVQGDEYLTAARRVLSEHPLIDGHNDLLITLRALYGNHINNNKFQDLFEKGGLPGQLDLVRIREGQLGGSFWSAFVPCPKNGSDFSNENYAPYVRATLEQLDLFQRLTTLYPSLFTPSRTAASANAAFKAGELISPLGIEGLHQIGNSLATLRLYHSLGVRYSTLTWNCHNRYADAALVSDPASGETVVSTPLWHGISPEGRGLIHEMNRLGMLVDLSHVSADTMRDVLHGHHDTRLAPTWEGSLAPPIFSHSSVHAICPHPRNVPDDVLRLVRQREGLVMINFAPYFISCEVDEGSETGLPRFVEANNTLAQVVRHIRYVGELVGYDHVGLGTDFDGIPSTPRGLEGVEKFPDLVAELLRQGVTEKDAGKIVGRNLLRVWAEADRVSEKMKKDGWKPLEDDISFSGETNAWDQQVYE